MKESIAKILGSQDTPVLQLATGELVVQDTGLHTNPEQWLHDNHWECDEVEISATGVGGEQPLGAAVPVGMSRRIRDVTIRNAGTNPTIVTLLISGGANKLTFYVLANNVPFNWRSDDGRSFAAGEISAVQTSDVTGGSTFVSASGVEK
jgi:hypothetical protein